MQLVLILYLSWLFGPASWVNSVATSNTLISESYKAYQGKKYAVACKQYDYIINTLGYRSEPLLMNYAHSLYRIRDMKKAQAIYMELLSSPSNIFRSSAWHQLGMISRNNPNKALLCFKKALLENPENANARYNFELLLSLNAELLTDEQMAKSAKSESQKKPSKGKRPVGDSNPDGSKGNKLEKADANQPKTAKGSAPKKGNGQAEGDSQEEGKDNKGKVNAENQILNKVPLDELGMSMEQAMQLLNAMQANEIQYLQQQKKGKAPANNSKDNRPKY